MPHVHEVDDLDGGLADQMGATLAGWLGVSPAGMTRVFPLLGNFSQRNLGDFG